MIKKKSLIKIILFVYPILTYFKVSLIGQLALSEPIAILSFLNIRKTRGLYKRFSDLRNISWALFIFLGVQMVSDLINHNDVNDMLRGWSSIIITIMAIVFFVRIFERHPEWIIIYFLGNFFRYALFGETSNWIATQGSLFDFGVQSVFKLRIAPMLTNLVLIISWYLLKSRTGKRLAVPILFSAYGIFLLIFGYRSLGAIFVMAAVLALSKRRIKNITRKKILYFLIPFLLIFQGFYVFYVKGALRGDFGTSAKVQMQEAGASYNPVSLLRIGRTEFFVGIAAAIHDPWLGYGSWAKDPGGKYNAMWGRIRQEAVPDFANPGGTGYIIPTHSILIGAWVDAGIIGLITMLFIWFFCLKRLIGLLKSRVMQKSPYYGILIFQLLFIGWAFLFSPLSSIRFDIPVIIAFIIVLNKEVAGISANKPIFKQQPVIA